MNLRKLKTLALTPNPLAKHNFNHIIYTLSESYLLVISYLLAGLIDKLSATLLRRMYAEMPRVFLLIS